MVTLNAEQQHAHDYILGLVMQPRTKNREVALMGYSGSGKTTTVAQIIKSIEGAKLALEAFGASQDKSMRHIMDSQLILAATTNKAAKVLGSTLDHHATSIHKALALKIVPNYRTGKDDLKPKHPRTITNSIVIIDESSMLDDALMGYLQARTQACLIIYVGDNRQANPVNSKNMPAFDIADKLVLNTVIRQSGNNFIKVLGEQLRQAIAGGPLPTKWHDGIDIIHYPDGNVFEQEMHKFFTADDYCADKGRFLCYKNKRAIQVNNLIRTWRYGTTAPQEGEEMITRKVIEDNQGRIIHTVEALVKVKEIQEDTLEGIPCYRMLCAKTNMVMYLPKDYDQVQRAIKSIAAECRKTNEWFEYFRVNRLYADLRPVYAGTVHTAQGSTYDEVFIDIDNLSECRNTDDLLRLLYVANTRAKYKVHLYGEI